jgi:hypothetical protein
VENSTAEQGTHHMVAPRVCRCGCGGPVRSDARGGFASQACYHRWNAGKKYSTADDAQIAKLLAQGLGARRIGEAMRPKRTKGMILRRLRTLKLVPEGDRRRFNLPPPKPRAAPPPRAQKPPIPGSSPGTPALARNGQWAPTPPAKRKQPQRVVSEAPRGWLRRALGEWLILHHPEWCEACAAKLRRAA